MSQAMEMETARSPPKLPAAEREEESRSAHDAGFQQTPGTLSCRAGLLNGAFDKVLQYGMQDPHREEFSQYFPSMDTDLVDALYDAYKQALALARSHCQEEYHLICSEHQVLERLHTLDKLAEVQQSATPAATPLGDGRITPSRKALAAGPLSQTASEAVVHNAESAARRYALRQEAAHLQDMLEKARRTENRLSLTLALRQEVVEKMATTYQRAGTDVKQVYDITRAWPTARQPKGSTD